MCIFQNQYEHHKEIPAAQGVKVIAKDLEKALAGLPLYVANHPDEIEYYKVRLHITNYQLFNAGKHTA